jgi:hypothetical protein
MDNFSWNIKLDLSVLQEAEQLINKLKDLTEDIDDVQLNNYLT